MKLPRVLCFTTTILVTAVVRSDVTFQQVASRLEVTFQTSSSQQGGKNKTSICQSGSIQFILEDHQGTNAQLTCEPFRRIYQAVADAHGDVLHASKNLMLQSIRIDDQHSELSANKHELIDETHAKYKFVNTNSLDDFACVEQDIVAKQVESGTDSDLFVVLETHERGFIGTRSEPDCIEDRVVSVVEIVEKFQIMGRNKASENSAIVMEDPSTETVDMTATLASGYPSISGTSKGPNSNNTIIVAVSCLVLSVVIPLAVFAHRYRNGRPQGKSPTQLSEWLVSSHNDDGSVNAMDNSNIDLI